MPLLPQSAVTHWVARSQAWPSARRATHAPALHHVSPLQSESVAHFAPHAPVAVLHEGALDGQGKVAVEPLSPVHPVHALFVVSQIGVVPTHAVPFAAVQATHWFVVGLHAGVTPEQVASVEQGSHFPLFGPLPRHSPERHWAVVVQVPSPEASPHLLSAGSQTPLAQTAVPTGEEQVPVSAGAWLATVGIGVPFASFGVQAPASHQFPLVQSASTLQPLAATQLPVVLQAPERHTVAAVATVQGPSPFG